MKVIKQLFWIFLFALLGEGIALVVASFIAVPGSVIGMVLLFLALHFDVLALDQVDEVGSWLTDNMSLFFVPAGVALMTNFDLLADVWLQLLIVIIVTVVLMMAFVGRVVQRLMKNSDANETLTERSDVNE